jgi:hypothetical protein
MGKVRYGQRRGRTAVLMDEHDIAQAARLCALYEVWQDEISAVEAHRGREEESDFLCESAQAGRWVARGCNENARVHDAAELRIFVVEAELFLGGSVGP